MINAISAEDIAFIMSSSTSAWLLSPLAPSETEWLNASGAYHLARKSGNFGLKSNGKVIFRKFRSEIVEYLQRYPSFSVRNGTVEISLPFA